METEALEARERRLWDLIADGDLDGFAACLAPDGIFVDGAEVQSAAGLVASLRDVVLKSFTLSHLAAVPLRPDAGDVVYRVDETIAASSGEASRRVVASSTWIKRDDNWLLTLHHESLDA